MNNLIFCYFERTKYTLIGDYYLHKFSFVCFKSCSIKQNKKKRKNRSNLNRKIEIKT